MKTTKIFKKGAVVLSIAAASVLAMTSVTGCAGVIDSTSESASAALEDPSVEAQLNRINTGINIVRTNYDILYNMPVSVDAAWVDEIINPISGEKRAMIARSLAYDPYYATVEFTNRISGKKTLAKISPLDMQLFNRLDALYVERPNIYFLPTSIDEYKQFKDAKLKKVEAKGGSLYKNVEEAVIALAPEDFQDSLNSAKGEFNEQTNKVLAIKGEIGDLEAFIDDDANKNSSELADKKAQLPVKEKELEEAEKVQDEKEKIYFELLAKAAVAMESNYDESKVPLAQKLDKLLEAVDTGAFQTGSLFAIAMVQIPRFMGQLDQELAVFDRVKNAAWFNSMTSNGRANAKYRIQKPSYECVDVDSGSVVDDKLCAPGGMLKAFIEMREERLAKGAIMALPNIAIGSYYAITQSSLAGKYQDLVDAVVDAYEADQEQKEAAAEAEAKAKAQEAK